VTADPKQGKRTVDQSTVRAFLLMHDECAACGHISSNAHHVIQKGAPHFGDDVPGNLLAICGTGSMRCHGAIHGGPYIVEHTGQRRDQEWVARRLGEAILNRPDVVAYVLGKLGEQPGREYLRRFYYVDVS